MGKRAFDANAPFQSIRGAAKLTGLSAGYIRSGCREGKIPHLKCGCEYRIDMARLWDALRAESSNNAKGGV